MLPQTLPGTVKGSTVRTANDKGEGGPLMSDVASVLKDILFLLRDDQGCGAVKNENCFMTSTLRP